MTRHTSVLAVFLVVAAGLPAGGAVDKQKNDAALQKGVAYLKTHYNDSAHGVGVPALAGLAMLEAEVPKADPIIVNIARIIRANGPGETKTYQLALSILFLDRLGDTADVPLIQLLGARLAAGQNSFGGWGYSSYPAVPEAEQLRLAGSLKPTASGGLHPEAAAVLRGPRTPGDADDNSNTQFAIIGTWVAQRRGVPMSATITAIDNRFLRTQSPSDHGWGYSSANNAAGSSTPAMTCAGLLGLAVGKANEEARKAGRRLEGEGSPKPKPKDDDPFFNPPGRNEKPKEEGAETDEEDEDQPKKKPNTVRDMAIERALQALGRVLKGGGGGGGPAPANTWGGVGDLYFVWSLERVAVAYGLDTIGDVDWYEWGTKVLLPAQQADGSWSGSHGVPVETAFAVLFLKKANFTADLSKTLNGKVKDPGNGELRGNRGGVPAIEAMGRKIDPNMEGPPDPKAPNLGKVRAKSEADVIALGLLAKQSDSKWDGRLKAARDGKGGQFTSGLAMAIPFLSDKRLPAAREALADRLTRMTPDTLKKAMADRDSELRRAACLAVAMRDEKKLTLDLIERVNDIDDIVVRAARASLKAMFNKDFGPPTGANDDHKRIALDQWKSWYTIDGPKP